MATTPNQPAYWPNLGGKCEPEVEQGIRLLYNGINDHETAITNLNTKVTANSTAATDAAAAAAAAQAAAAAAAATAAAAMGSSVTLGGVNNQTGTSYVLMATDLGGIVTLNNTAAVAMSLNSSLPSGFFGSVENLGTGLATLTPTVGNVNGVAAITLGINQSCFLYFDGTNWWAATSPQAAQTIAVVAHYFLTAYNAATGQFSAAQPAFTDISGTATTAQIPNLPQSQITGLVAALAALAPLASPTFTGTVTQPTPSVVTAATTATTATAGTATALPTLPLGYLQMSLNGVTVKIPYYSV